MKKHVVVIGAGFSGLSTAAYLARDGFKVTVLEKNNQPGGRAFTLHQDGFRFELGPSWYMMPDVFEEFFSDFGTSVNEQYKLQRLDPSYRVFFSGGQSYDLSSKQENIQLFSRLEPGAGVELERFLDAAEKLYNISRDEFLPNNYKKISTLLSLKLVKNLFHVPILGSYHTRVKHSFHDPRLQQILEFMTVFLGGSAKNIPALYTLLAHVDMNQGIWYPEGGFEKLASVFEENAKKQGAAIKYNHEVTRIEVKAGTVQAVRVGKKRILCDAVVGASDYHHIETKLLTKQWQAYSADYWKKRTLSPSAILISVGLNTHLQGLKHHNLFFDSNWQQHFRAIEDGTKIDEPLFYTCVPSKSDESSAPAGHENVFILVPITNGGDISKEHIDMIKTNVLERISERAQVNIADYIVSEDIRTQAYFTDTFNAFKGNSFGLAHTLKQSAFLRPRMQSKKLENLFYAGQYTNPGTGVPLCVLSGKVVSRLVKNEIEKEV